MVIKVQVEVKSKVKYSMVASIWYAIENLDKKLLWGLRGLGGQFLTTIQETVKAISSIDILLVD